MAANISVWIKDQQDIHTAGPNQRTLVTLAYAQSLDGVISSKQGLPTAISGQESMVLTHRIRAVHAGILVGVGTVLADDPQLTVRYGGGSSPRPVILDTELRTPVNARLLIGTRQPVLFCSHLVDRRRQELYRQAGFNVIPLVQSRGRLDLGEVLAKLFELGMTSLMVEGGGEVLQSFLCSGLWDLAVITIAPQWMGGYRVVNESLPNPVRLKELLVEQIGEDIIIAGKNEQRT